MIDFENGFFRKLKIDKEPRISDVENILLAGESVIASYTATRDYVIFTNKRVMSVNVQGLTGKKKDFTSIPYANIIAFSIETAGTVDADCELDLLLSTIGTVRFEFTNTTDIYRIGKAISQYVLK